MAVLKQAEVGVPVAELIRKVGISEQTFYRWKKQYVGLEVDQAPSDEATSGREHPVEAIGRRFEAGQDDAAGCAAKKVVKPSGRRPLVDHLRPVSGERAARLPGSADGARHVSLPESSGTMDRVADADTGDRTEQSALRVSQDPRAAEPRGLERGEISGVSAVQGRRPGLKKRPQRKRKAVRHREERFDRHGAESGLEHRLRSRSVAGWDALPGADDHRCVHAGKCRHRSRAEPERRRCGASVEPLKQSVACRSCCSVTTEASSPVKRWTCGPTRTA